MAAPETTAGDLDRRIKLCAPVVSRDPTSGEDVTGYPITATVWGKVLETSAAESVKADQRVMTREITVRIRWRADVRTTWRVTYGTRVLAITGSTEVGRRQWLDLTCEEYSGG